MPANITFTNPDDFNSLTIDGHPFNALSQAYGALTIQKDREELNAAVLTFLGEHRQRMKLAEAARADEKEARIALATDRNQCKQAAADAEANNERFQREFSEQMEALKAAHAEEVKGLNDEIAQVRAAHDGTINAANITIADFKEQLRIAKLPPAEQRAKELDAAMAAKEAELAAMKAEHAALLP